jgi:hypothetical protein
LQGLYALVRGHGTTLRLEVNGVEGVSSAESPVELRFVEGSMLSKRKLLNVIQETQTGGRLANVGKQFPGREVDWGRPTGNKEEFS